MRTISSFCSFQVFFGRLPFIMGKLLFTQAKPRAEEEI